jgi:hypothetical protein
VSSDNFASVERFCYRFVRTAAHAYSYSPSGHVEILRLHSAHPRNNLARRGKSVTGKPLIKKPLAGNAIVGGFNFHTEDFMNDRKDTKIIETATKVSTDQNRTDSGSQKELSGAADICLYSIFFYYLCAKLIISIA